MRQARTGATGAATTTRTGLKVQDELDTGIMVTEAHINALAVTRHRFHGGRNHTLHPEQPGIPCAERATPTAFSTEAP
ncbi:hypothetical protein ACFYXH_36145 [Streptomyces sp. NPDC002730]|uniref:hypothetical protein n=1 Tax=Streptomyces sp. NPDC002730 TaxID=3364662 RepID=UPI0036BBB8C5